MTLSTHVSEVIAEQQAEIERLKAVNLEAYISNMEEIAQESTDRGDIGVAQMCEFAARTARQFLKNRSVYV